MTTAASLETVRAEFNAYYAEPVSTLVGLGPEALERLGYAEIAERIPDPVVRTRYVKLAIGPLEANINGHRDLARRIEPETTSPLPVVAALVGAATAYWFFGTIAALLAAALLYWSFARQARVVLRDSARQAEAHNALTADWQQTIEEWQIAIRALRRLGT